MQAWAGFAQAGTVVIASFVAANTFKSWKRQRIEERRISSSEQLLSLTYNIRRAFNVIRSPVVSQLAKDEALFNLLQSNLDIDSYPADQQRKIIDSQVVLDRLNRFSEIWDEFSRALPLGTALFGPKVEESLTSIWRQKMAIQVAAEQYPVDDCTDAEFTSDISMTLWENRQRVMDPDDKVSRAVAKAILDLEHILLPIIRSNI